MKLLAFLLLAPVALTAQDRGAVAFNTLLAGASIRDIAVDTFGNIYVAGATSALPNLPNTFSTTAGAYQTQFRRCSVLTNQVGCSEAFVAKFESSGKLIYATLLGGSVNDQATAITVDAAGDAIVTGFTYSADFPTTVNAAGPNFGGTYVHLPYSNPFPPGPGGDIFIAKINSTGSTLLFSTLLGGSGDEVPSSVAVDSQNNVYVGGRTTSTNFPVTNRAYSSLAVASTIGNGSGFITKISADGTLLLYSTYFDLPVAGLAVDPTGAVYLTGKAPASLSFPATAGAFQTSQAGASSAYVAKLKADGSGLAYATLLGGSGGDSGTGIAVDTNGDAFVTGQADSTNFPLLNSIAGQTGTAFLAGLKPDGSGLLFSTRIGGDRASRVLLDMKGNLDVFGLAANYSIPVTSDAFEKSTTGNFVERFDIAGKLLYATALREGTPYGVDALGNPLFGTRTNTAGGIAKIDFALLSTAPVVAAVVNAASYDSTVIAPGEIVSLFGERLGPAAGMSFTLNGNGQVGTSLGDVTVTIDGAPIPLLYVSSTQINAVAPFGLKPGTNSNVVVQYGIATSTSFGVNVVAANSGIIRDGVGGNAMQAAVINQDGTVNSPANPAPLGSTVSIYATGLGVETPLPANGSVINDAAHRVASPVTVTFDDSLSATVTYAGSAPGFVAGLNQVNVQLPQSLPVGSATSQLTVQIRVGKETSGDSGAIISIR